MAWLAVLALAGGYEAYALMNRIPGDTLSEAVWRISFKRPLIPFLAGMLAGHFWWMSDKCAEVLK